jgi:FKBP-type peptidyl-prolyl cis-trans isomerase (trigger factor)
MSENKKSESKNYNIKNKEEKNSQLTLEIEVKKDYVGGFKSSALKNLGKDVEVKGFRKGSVPENILIENIGEMKLWEEQSYQALHEIMPEVVEGEKVEALTSPQISVTKIAPGADLEFKAVFPLMPKVELADYKKIATDIKIEDKVEVTDKEIEDYIEYIRKNRAEAEYVQKKTNGEEVDEKEKENLPEITDEFVKTLGEFKNVADFKKQLTENLQKEKEASVKNKRRTEIIEKVIEESKVELPDIIIEEEKNRMLEQYKADIERMGIKFEDYIKELKKSEEDLKKEWNTDATKRAKMNLILPNIAKEEKITADQEKLEKELKHITEHHKEISDHQARHYLSHVLTNEAVFEFLENIK